MRQEMETEGKKKTKKMENKLRAVSFVQLDAAERSEKGR